MELVNVLMTSAGMHALWDVAAFVSIDGYDAWSRELEDDRDILQHIEAGHFVPINIGSDGAFCFAVRTDPNAMPALSADEERRVVVSSDACRLKTAGRIAAGGIEYVGRVDDTVAEGQLEPGDYDAIVHLMDYGDVPNRTNEHPDFVITLGPRTADSVRTAIETFTRRGD